ncbi:uncharacterized protein LOC126381933, partial [Pectinophora gossypiella]|uniref:uncharacterized protein LOC126381933 n=1 Tax=Pectinophora gossypiella TaxID=13191 RepID=UPI00214E06C6
RPDSALPLLIIILGTCLVDYKRNPAPDGHRCGVCPHYFQKICAFNFQTNSTYIFDNHCIMDLYNCIEGTEFQTITYEHCLYFGNFGYVHGFKYEDEDYGEDHVIIKGSKKNPDYRKQQRS